MHNWWVSPVALQHELPTQPVRSCQTTSDGCGVAAYPSVPRAVGPCDGYLRRCVDHCSCGKAIGSRSTGCMPCGQVGSMHPIASRSGEPGVPLQRARCFYRSIHLLSKNVSIAPVASCLRVIERGDMRAVPLRDAKRSCCLQTHNPCARGMRRRGWLMRSTTRGDHAAFLLVACLRYLVTYWCAGAMYITCSCRQRRSAHFCGRD